MGSLRELASDWGSITKGIASDNDVHRLLVRTLFYWWDGDSHTGCLRLDTKQKHGATYSPAQVMREWHQQIGLVITRHTQIPGSGMST